MGDRLRPLWDFGDLDASEARFRAQLGQETTDAGRAEVLTQLARVEGLRGGFEQCDALLDDAEALGGAEARVLLERGRRERSSGRPGAGVAQFEEAFELARASGQDVLAVDAVHMLAIVADSETWTARGVEIAASSDDPGVRYWLGPLYNNAGWARYEAGDAAGALEAFELGLASRERDDPRPYARETARYAIGKALRGLGRADEAAAALERCLAWAAEAGVEDAYFHEELAEDYAALGRYDDARAQARRALELLSDEDDPARVARLRELSLMR
jgi:tetratricopeptide (TPR) repeat protein